MLSLRKWNARPLVLHVDAHAICSLSGQYADCRIGWGIFRSVTHEVDHDLCNAIWIGIDERQVRWYVNQQIVTESNSLQFGLCTSQDVLQRYNPGCDAQYSRLDARQV